MLGLHSGTWICPLLSEIHANALAKIKAGLPIKPPQFPEWCAPSRKFTSISKTKLPRDPIKSVGRSGCNRGPSDEISTSAFNIFLLFSANSDSPGEPDSSPVSIMIFELKPKFPRVFKIADKAPILMLCCPLLSAVPRPYILSPSINRDHGVKFFSHFSS